MRPFRRATFLPLKLILSAFLLTLLFHLSAGCSTIHTGQRTDFSRSGPPDPKNNLQQSLIISHDSNEFLQNPKLLQRIRRGPHGYFRYINSIFAEAVCVRFQQYLDEIPNVNLHGDAHSDLNLFCLYRVCERPEL